MDTLMTEQALVKPKASKRQLTQPVPDTNKEPQPSKLWSTFNSLFKISSRN
jgi:hypothetical protein